ncbi:MAG: iron ABC transporter permease [Marinagarivorans sp.]
MPIKAPLLFLFLTLALLVAMAWALGAGSIALSWGEIGRGLWHGASSEGLLIWQLRVPRLLAAACCGALLALAGALMQLLLRNPLADPAVLGISAGASFFALTALGLGLGVAGLALYGFAGALVAIALVLVLADVRRGWQAQRVLLTGVVVAAGFGAGISFWLTLSSDLRLHSMLFWLMGDLSDASVPLLPAVGLVVALIVVGLLAGACNVLLRGELAAQALGVPVAPVRWSLFLVACGCTALAVSIGGNLGFIGLVAPHSLRLLGVWDQRILLPASALLGALLLVLADTAARLLLAPVQIPVGVLTAAFGVPLLLYLLRQQSMRMSDA